MYRTQEVTLAPITLFATLKCQDLRTIRYCINLRPSPLKSLVQTHINTIRTQDAAFNMEQVIITNLLLYILSRPTLSVDLVMYRESVAFVQVIVQQSLRLEVSSPVWEDHLLKPSTYPHATELRSPLRGGTRQYMYVYIYLLSVSVTVYLNGSVVVLLIMCTCT